MLGADHSIQAVPYTGPADVRPSQPPPQQRVVESAARSTLDQQQTRSMYASPPSGLQQLVSSARQFADILDSTGNVQVASYISGFRVGALDTYA